jgi:hypothetical protein
MFSDRVIWTLGMMLISALVTENSLGRTHTIKFVIWLRSAIRRLLFASMWSSQNKPSAGRQAGARTPKPLLPQQQCFRNFLLNATALAMNSSSHLDLCLLIRAILLNARRASNIKRGGL